MREESKGNRISVIIDGDIFDLVNLRANIYFGGNRSAYVNALVRKDIEKYRKKLDAAQNLMRGFLIQDDESERTEE